MLALSQPVMGVVFYWGGILPRSVAAPPPRIGSDGRSALSQPIMGFVIGFGPEFRFFVPYIKNNAMAMMTPNIGTITVRAARGA